MAICLSAIMRPLESKKTKNKLKYSDQGPDLSSWYL